MANPNLTRTALFVAPLLVLLLCGINHNGFCQSMRANLFLQKTQISKDFWLKNEIEEEEEEVEELVDDEDADNANTATEIDVKNSVSSEEEKKKHAELLALPPHGSEVYIGGIPHDADDLGCVWCRKVGL
ncbi:hypothetical protein ACLB2K_029296 [Fragaria x ananassa]